MHVPVLVMACTLLAAAAFAQETETLARGSDVYAARRCALCHSIGQEGNRQGPLDDVGSRLSADEIRSWIVEAPEMAERTGAERVPAMPAYRDLEPEDLEALVAYLQSLTAR